MFASFLFCFFQVRTQLRFVHVYPLPILALQLGLQDPPFLRRQALPSLVTPQHVGGAHDRPQRHSRWFVLNGWRMFLRRRSPVYSEDLHTGNFTLALRLIWSTQRTWNICGKVSKRTLLTMQSPNGEVSHN